jgi:hypothetical protein
MHRVPIPAELVKIHCHQLVSCILNIISLSSLLPSAVVLRPLDNNFLVQKSEKLPIGMRGTLNDSRCCDVYTFHSKLIFNTREKFLEHR